MKKSILKAGILFIFIIGLTFVFDSSQDNKELTFSIMKMAEAIGDPGGGCGDVKQAECYEYANGTKACMHVSEVGNFNCKA